jgi:hypothetical protein
LLGSLQSQHGIADIAKENTKTLVVYPANDLVFDDAEFKSFGQLADDGTNGLTAIDLTYSGEALDPDFNESGAQGLGAALRDFLVDISEQGFIIQKPGILVMA